MTPEAGTTPEAGSQSAAAIVLVADGEIITRHAIAGYLRDCGYRVIEAATTDEARTILEQPHLRVDAILCDAKIGGAMNGFEFRKWAGEHRPQCQIVLAGSAASATDAAADLCEDGPRLARPYDPQSVLDYIKRMLAGRDRSDMIA
jgi:DNA-binding NtrC family response regulator